MSIRILTKNGVDNTNIDGARDNNFNSGRRSGIVKGGLKEGNFYGTGNTLVLESCELRLCGHRVIIDSAESRQFYDNPTSPYRQSFIGQIQVDKDKNVSFDFIVQDTNTELIQDNLDIDGTGTYQLEIGRFTQLPNGNLEDVVRTADLITGGLSNNETTINIGKVTTQTLDAGIDAEVDVEQRYDTETKKTYTDFNFGIPRGFNGLDGSGINPNLLINADFGINQRGIYRLTNTHGYMADRWLKSTGSAFDVEFIDNNCKATVSLTGTGYISMIKQTIEIPKSLYGKTLTASMNITNLQITGTSIYGIISFRDTENNQIDYEQFPNLKLGLNTVTFVVPNNISYLAFSINSNRDIALVGDTITFDSPKIEIGNVATTFGPRPYAEELAMCQRYFIRLKPNVNYGTFCNIAVTTKTTNEDGTNTYAFNGFVPLPSALRTVGTFTSTGRFTVLVAGIYTDLATALENVTYNTNGVTVRASYTLPASNNTNNAGMAGLLRASSDIDDISYIDIDAEIY